MFNNSKTKFLVIGTSLGVCFLSYYLWKKDLLNKFIFLKHEEEVKKNINNKKSWADIVEEEEKGKK